MFASHILNPLVYVPDRVALLLLLLNEVLLKYEVLIVIFLRGYLVRYGLGCSRRFLFFMGY
jgi:hypothetical protein